MGLSPYSPTSNTLGPYTTVLPGFDHSAMGWWFAVQLQGNLQGDTNQAHWIISQSIVSYGTYEAMAPDGTLVGPLTYFDFNVDDSPPLKAVFRGNGMVDWLDAPGDHLYTKFGYTIVSDSATFVFRSTLFNFVTGDSCSVTWRMRLEVHGGAMTAWLE